MTLVPHAELKTWPEMPWRERSKPALHKKLASEQGPHWKDRLHQVGNIVMPNVAHLAMNLLGRFET